MACMLKVKLFSQKKEHSFHYEAMNLYFEAFAAVRVTQVIKLFFLTLSFEMCHEKTCFLHVGNKGAVQLYSNGSTYQPLCFHYIDCTIPLLPKCKIPSLKASPEAVQPGLCRTWSETPKTSFSHDAAHFISPRSTR